MKKNIFYLYLFAFVGLLTTSCDRYSKKHKNMRGNNDTLANEKYYSITNKTSDIGEIKVIYLYVDYWDGMWNVTFGIDDRTIDSKIMEIFPDTVSDLGSHHFGYVPNKVYLDQEALNYFGDYVINNCDTFVYEKYFNNTVYQIFLLGENGIIECMYVDPKRVSEFFTGMIEWINKYPIPEDIDTVIPYIKPMTKYVDRNLE